MRIENEIKLDFKDVLIRPKRSTLNSRKDVYLEREWNFKNGKRFAGIPIIVANMDTVGTMKMARALKPHHMCVALHKFYEPKELYDFFRHPDSYLSFYTLGTSDADLDKFRSIYKELETKPSPYPISDIILGKVGENHYLNKVCIDVANGYSEHFNSFIKKATFPEWSS